MNTKGLFGAVVSLLLLAGCQTPRGGRRAAGSIGRQSGLPARHRQSGDPPGLLRAGRSGVRHLGAGRPGRRRANARW